MCVQKRIERIEILALLKEKREQNNFTVFVRLTNIVKDSER